jgi:hypothetical protein
MDTPGGRGLRRASNSDRRRRWLGALGFAAGTLACSDGINFWITDINGNLLRL